MPSRGWVMFKSWMRDCILRTHLERNYKKNGDLKFPKYIYICDCGDMGCNDRRNPATVDGIDVANLNSSINYHYNSEHGHWEEEDHEVETYIKEDEVLLKKGQINSLSWNERMDLIKRLK